jgi:hypothetical protein
MRRQDPDGGPLSVRDPKWQTVSNVAVHRLDEGLVGATDEPNGGDPLVPQPAGRLDPVCSVDQAALFAPDDDGRPLPGSLHQGGDMPLIEPPCSSLNSALDPADQQISDAMTVGYFGVRTSGQRHANPLPLNNTARQTFGTGQQHTYGQRRMSTG